MATTTNYGWTTPDDTALVKDGASAIRTLGTSVDTTTKALNPSTTLGDIEYRSSTANTNTRLGIGSTGNVLTVAGGVPSWATPSSGGMTLLSTTTLSGATTTISSIDQTYNNLYVLIQNPFFSLGSREMIIKPNATSSIADYTSNAFRSSAVYNSGYNALDLITEATMPTTTTPLRNNFALQISNYANAVNGKVFRFFGAMSVTDLNFNAAGVFRTASAITSLQFSAPNTGSFSGGTVLVYGVK